MRFVDDIRRHTVVSDYEQVVGDLISEIADDDLTICRYGGCQPPISDLDLVVLTEPSMSTSRVRTLRARLDAFRTASPLRQYLVDDEIRLCPSDLFSQASGGCLNMVPSPITQLSGPTVQLTPPPTIAPYWQIALVNNLASQVIELGDLSGEAASSLRYTLKTVSRVCGFGRAHIDRSLAYEGRTYADADVRAAFGALDSEVAALRQRAVEHVTDDAFDTALLACLDCARRVLVQALHVYCDDFLRSVLTITRPSANAPSDLEVPDLARCHIAAHAAVAPCPSAFQTTLERWAPAGSFRVSDEGYRRALCEQMETVQAFEARFQRLGLASFPLAVAGVWHRSYPTTTWETLRSRFMPGSRRVSQGHVPAAGRDSDSSRH